MSHNDHGVEPLVSSTGHQGSLGQSEPSNNNKFVGYANEMDLEDLSDSCSLTSDSTQQNGHEGPEDGEVSDTRLEAPNGVSELETISNHVTKFDPADQLAVSWQMFKQA